MRGDRLPAGGTNKIINMDDQIINFLKIKQDIPSVFPHELFHIGPITYSTSTMMATLSLVFFAIIAYNVSKFNLVPNKFQSLVEIIVTFIHDFISNIVGSKEKGYLLLPYIGSVFLFIIFANLLPLLPFIGGLEWHGSHLFTAATADFNTTFSLALASVVMLHLTGLRKNGTKHHLLHFIQIDKVIKGFQVSLAEGLLGIIHFFVGLIEIIGEFAKIISLSLRLFGNIFAHEVLMIILLGSMSVFVPAIWMGMGVLVGVVQSIVFMALLTVYYSLLVVRENSH
jgi:F-type H+-transporting ATPase subunit a